jgi:large repetitive protein
MMKSEARRLDAPSDRIRVTVPGCRAPLIVERTAEGRLLTIAGGDRVYVDARTRGRIDYDGGFVVAEHTELPGGFVRRLRATRRAWTEAFRWDEAGRLVEVDGVRIRHDDQGRVIACSGEAGRWLYAYSGAHLTVIDTPRGLRQILRGQDGRAWGYREADHTVSTAYDEGGRRLPTRACPVDWNVDAVGRLWSITGEDGRVVLTYLWDGWHCLGAIGGEPGAPMSAVYSLDPTGTPVRLITRDGVTRLPRDAFGEALLDTPGVPGLYGGAVADGLVHLPYRRLDPRTGSFDVPDPMDGEKHDPRRAAGWRGPLPVELPASGPYTVCRNNPVSLADPTGAISDLWWLIPSALTWSIQNTIGSLLGMWFNLEFSPLGWIVSAAAGAKPFDVEWVTAKNFDCFGLRADGWMSRIQPVAWTYQFLVNEERASFTALEDARLFAPDAAFRPTLYGTVLRCAPADSAVFLVRGQRNAPNGTVLTDWSRCGGAAEPALPNSRVPVFPAGGLHFNTVQRGVRRQRADLIEIEPSGTVLTGATGDFAALTVPGTGLNFAPNAAIVLTDPAGVVEVARVLSSNEVSGSTLVRVDSTLSRLAAGAIHLEGLTGPAGTESLMPVAGQNRLLNVAGSSSDYQPSVSVVRLSRAGTAVHFAKVDGLEAQLALDAAVPAAVAANFSVRSAVASGNFTGQLTATPTVFQVTSGAPPAAGNGVLVGSGATAIPAIVQSVSAPLVTVDRDLSALGGANTPVPWQLLAAGAELGVRTAAPEADARVTYTPGSAGLAPAAGFVWLQGAVTVARRISARTYDAVVMSQPRPDNQPDPYDVERFRLAAPDVSGVTRSQVRTFALSAPPPANTTAFHIVEFPGTAVTAGGVLLPGAALAGANATASVNPGSPPGGLRASEVVVLVPSPGTPQAAMIRRLRLRVTLERGLPVGPDNIEAASLVPDTITYTADRIDDRVLRVHPISGTTRVDMPRFAPGDLVQAQWPAAAPTDRRFYRVLSAAGTTITCGDDEAVVPPGTTDIAVTRLVVADPGTGGSRLGIQGRRVSNTEIEFSVWDASHYGRLRMLAIIDGATVFAARVADTPQPLTLELAIAGNVSGTVDIARPPAGGTAFASSFSSDGATLNVSNLPFGAAGPGFAALVPYIDTTRRVAGELHPGTVRVPEDHENVSMELTRRQSLEDHELTHTLQSARLGPLMLVVFPLWAIELATDLTAAGGPAFSPYVAGTLAAGRLTIPSPGGVTFEANGRVQIAQNRRSVLIQLGPAVDGGFRLPDSAQRQLSSSGFLDGAVQVRRPLGSTGTDILEWITNIGQLLTIGGLLNVLSVAGWGGVAAIIVQIVQAIRRAARSSVNVPIADDHRTLTLSPGQGLDGLAAGVLVALKSGDQIYIRAVDTLQDRTIVLGAPVPLSGTVELSVYSPGAALFGLRSYYPATVPDENRPARLQILAVGGDRLSLSVHDRIEVRSANGASFRTLVTAVDGEIAELEEPVLTREDAPNEFLVGKIGAEDPTGWVDQWLLNELHVGWMQYLHDPWGQILYRAQPGRRDTAAQIFARSARYLFGTQSWMCVFLGFFWNDNAYQRANPHRSRMEQEASRKSGDTYCPLGSLHGDVPVIGDVARYWFTVSGGTRDGSGNTPTDLITFSFQDAPGVNTTQAPTLVMPAGASFSLPADLYSVNAAGNFTGIGSRGWIPASAHLERSAGFHVAFSRPPGAGTQYQITGRARGGVGAGEIADSIDAQNNNAATLFFNRTPADVTVTMAGLPVAENAILDVIPFQQAVFAVVPDGSRVYRATAGGQGTTFDVDGLAVTARSALGIDDVEISRLHRFNAATGAYDSGIGPIHLPADLDIAVRRFQMRIQDRVPLRATLDHTAAAVANARAGDTGFILVPAQFAPAAVTSAVLGTPSLTPQITSAAAAIPPAVQPFLGDGGVLQVVFPADQPPEQAATVTITIRVGPDAASSVPVRCAVPVDPHFTLEVVGGGAFQVARGASVVLRSSDGTAIDAAGATPGITLTPANDQITVAVDAGFGPTSVTILVRDTASPQRLARRTLTIV